MNSMNNLAVLTCSFSDLDMNKTTNLLKVAYRKINAKPPALTCILTDQLVD